VDEKDSSLKISELLSFSILWLDIYSIRIFWQDERQQNARQVREQEQ
jgi:hypothetical protein